MRCATETDSAGAGHRDAGTDVGAYEAANTKGEAKEESKPGGKRIEPGFRVWRIQDREVGFS